MNKQTSMAIAVALIIGAVAGYWFAPGMAPTTDTVATTRQQAEQRTPLFYRNPMNPSITSPVPAKDEMGMDYVPVYKDDDQAADEPTGTVKINPVTVQSIGVRTVRAERRALAHTIRAVGRVAYDEGRLTRLHPKVEGWVEQVNVNNTGDPVADDQVLLSIYSPQLVATQQELVLAYNNRETLATSPFEDIRKGADEMVSSARQRLQLMDVPQHQLRELERTRQIKKSLHIHAPSDGIVVKIDVREGQYVTPKDQLYMFADLSTVWVYVDIYENEVPWVKAADKATIQVASIPGRTFEGKVAYVYPYLESRTRTVKVRLEFDNSEQLLKPDMFANVTIDAGAQPESIVIPTEAVVRSGPREQVFVVREAGKFEPRPVEIGISADGLTQVLRGLDVGEQVVTSSQFLIDSESKLREATAKMLERNNPDSQPKPENAPSTEPGTDMSNMSMGELPPRPTR